MKQIITNNPQDTGHVLGVTTNRNKSFWEFLTKGQKSTVLISADLGNKSDILKKLFLVMNIYTLIIDI